MASSTKHSTRATKGDEGHSRCLSEVYNVDALKAALQHPGLDSETKRKLQAIKKSLTNGNRLVVQYGKNNKMGWGRYYANKGLGLQMLDADVRNALCASLVHDIDVENCHPTILMQLCKKMGWACTHLKQLCKKREEILLQIQEAYEMDRVQAKTVLLKLMYLGGLPLVGETGGCFAKLGLVCGQRALEDPAGEEPQPQDTSSTATSDAAAAVHHYLVGLQAELQCISANVAAAYPGHAKEAERQRKARNKVTGHPLATALALVLSNEENNILLSMVRALEKANRCVTTLIYDGLHVRRLEGEEELPADLLLTCEAAVKQDTGYCIKLCQKPMNSTLELGELVASAEEEMKSPFVVCRDLLLAVAKKHGLIRLADLVWEPIEGTTCAYKPAGAGREEFGDFINAVIGTEPALQDHPENFDKLVKYLRQINHKESFPIVAAFDRHLMSFRNGTYILPEDKFVPHSSPEAQGLKGRVARVHHDLEWTGSMETPNFDKLVGFQIRDPKAFNWVFTLNGRMWYRVGERDTWQVMAYYYGLGGSGKSAILQCMNKSFGPGAVRKLGANTEKVFGLEKLIDLRAEAIFFLDMPEDASNTLDKELWKNIVSGEEVPVPRKGLAAKDVVIDCHLAGCSNFVLGYRDRNGDITRRVVPFHFTEYVTPEMVNGDLVGKIYREEMPALIRRCNKAYLDATGDGNGRKDIWSLLPTYFHELRKETGAATNDLMRYLQSGWPEEPSYEDRWIPIKEEGAMTRQDDLMKGFRAYMRDNQEDGRKVKVTFADGELAPCFQMGFIRSTETTCKACHKLHCAKPKCCPHYTSGGKTKKQWWTNLKLIKVDAGQTVQVAGGTNAAEEQSDDL